MAYYEELKKMKRRPRPTKVAYSAYTLKERIPKRIRRKKIADPFQIPRI